MLVAAMNPCPCGYLGDPKKECRCSPGQIDNYRQRISGPLLDRIDLHVEVPAVDYKQLSGSDGSGEDSQTIRNRVENCRAIQQRRFAKHRSVATNTAMPAKLVRQHCQLEAESHALLEQAMNDLNFSARAHDRILKVARTLADLDSAEQIRPGTSSKPSNTAPSTATCGREGTTQKNTLDQPIKPKRHEIFDEK